MSVLFSLEYLGKPHRKARQECVLSMRQPGVDPPIAGLSMPLSMRLRIRSDRPSGHIYLRTGSMYVPVVGAAVGNDLERLPRLLEMHQAGAIAAARTQLRQVVADLAHAGILRALLFVIGTDHIGLALQVDLRLPA